MVARIEHRARRSQNYEEFAHDGDRNRDSGSRLFPFGDLSTQQERLREFPIATDLPVAKSIEEVVAKRRRQIGPLNGRHLLAEGHAGQVFLDALLLLGIASL